MEPGSPQQLSHGVITKLWVFAQTVKSGYKTTCC